MQICSSSKSYSPRGIKKSPILAAVLLASIFTAVLNAQETPAFPEMPSISASSGPAMPSVSAPTIGSRYYTPKIQKTYMAEENSAPDENTLPSSATFLLDGEEFSEDDALSLAGQISKLRRSRLSAQDLILMERQGGLSNIFQNASSKANTVMSESSTTSSAKNTGESYARNTGRSPAIIRFIANGQNILDSCRTVYFSTKENDGSFLLTGDRKFYVGERAREETFYFLFKSDGNPGSRSGYFVQGEVIQDFENKSSVLHGLSKKDGLKAVKTGNLVSLRSKDSDLNMDLLLDIGE